MLIKPTQSASYLLLFPPPPLSFASTPPMARRNIRGFALGCSSHFTAHHPSPASRGGLGHVLEMDRRARVCIGRWRLRKPGSVWVFPLRNRAKRWWFASAVAEHEKQKTKKGSQRAGVARREAAMSMEHDHAQEPVQAMRPREAGPALDSPCCVLRVAVCVCVCARVCACARTRSGRRRRP